MTPNQASTLPAGLEVQPNTFSDDTPLWPTRPGSPRYGDERWDLTDVVVQTSMGERFIDFSTVPAHHLVTVKNFLMVLAAPDRDAVIKAGVVRRGDGANPRGLYDAQLRLATIARWSDAHSLRRFADWTQPDADRFLEALTSGEHREDGYGVGASTVRGYVESLRLLREFREVLPDALTFRPWGALSSSHIAGLETRTENSTPPLPWDHWAPLMAASWVIVDQFSDDIISAFELSQAIPASARGPGGNNAYQALLNWDREGGALPLHTEFGRSSVQRGTPNKTLLFRLLGLSPSIIKPAHRQYRPAAVSLIEAAARNPDRARLGGLVRPTAVVTQSNGTQTLWVDEIGLGETEHLVSVLRAACYVLIASLTGMRDSEIQELTRGTITEKDGLPALRSVQFKGNDHIDGEHRAWWAPRPVMRTIEVLTRLSRHATHLFARDAENAGSYASSRDIPRLVAFVNDDPATRVGRGHGLALDPIPIRRGQPVNATSLRRSFAVYATTHPGAELGLGIQLGHAAWRMTSGYMSDGQQRAVRQMGDERQRILHADAAALVLDTSPVSGPSAQRITAFRAQVIADPERAERIAASVAERLYLGLTNDCMWNPATSGCGSERPQLGSHICVGLDCTNALVRAVHLPIVQNAVERIDAFLDQDRGNPDLIERMRRDRANLVRTRRELADPTQDDTAEQEARADA